VRGGGPMEFRRACQIMAEIAEALAFAHERGVIHRDVKPANLMLSGGGRCKLADFGLAILNSRFSDKSASGIAGTPQFIAPELIKGEPASPQSDIYSLGATLWFLLTASPPFSADSVPELLDKQLNDPLPKLTRLRPDVPDTLVRAISKAMEKDPASRYENAEQFASVLRIHTIPVGGTASSLANLGGLLPPSKPVPVRRAILLGGMAAMICVAIMAIPVYWLANGWLRPTNHSTHVTSDYSLSPRPLVATSPEKTPVKVSSSQPAPAIAPGKIFQATDTAMLKQLASSLASADDSAAPAQVVVEGVVTSNHPSKRAKYFRIGFSDDNDDNNNDFGCIYRPELLPALQAKFGSADGLGLTGKRIRVTGHLEMFKERPAIKIDASDQIEIVK